MGWLHRSAPEPQAQGSCRVWLLLPAAVLCDGVDRDAAGGQGMGGCAIHGNCRAAGILVHQQGMPAPGGMWWMRRTAQLLCRRWRPHSPTPRLPWTATPSLYSRRRRCGSGCPVCCGDAAFLVVV